ncbi:erythromycin esterase family protein [Streptomyces dubilierae]|uniref:Erythromycin esterase family protein n=1 Tax=Streptomyces dubilierae TaxID=3075533 RepID=A0ABU2PK27_9ACTN|nr:erythromycin esterase family protein [Streptomyces sp. DSM 41921]
MSCPRPWTLLVLALTLLVPAPAAAAPRTPPPDPVVAALERGTHPLRTAEPGGDTRDLEPLGRAVGDAVVVGAGEATHGSHDFLALKARVFRYLVERRGFRTFALETAWSTGVRLDDYVVHGKGDPERIMREDLQYTYALNPTAENLALVRWMREYNRRRPHDPVRFMGDDWGYTGPELYDRVTDWVARVRPRHAPRFEALYRGLRPAVPSGAYQRAYLARPLAERRAMAARTGRALRLLRTLAPGGPAAHREFAEVLRHATVIDQTATGYGFDFADPDQVAEAMRRRDEDMADNVLWWQAHTGHRVLLSGHNNHIGYRPEDPQVLPRTQGAVLRDRLGSGYASVGLTFGQGSFKATDPEEERMLTHTVGPMPPGANEHTLDRVRHDRWVLDLRTAPAPARRWLAGARPTRSVGTAYPEPRNAFDIALGRCYDVLVHQDRVRAVDLLPAP